MRSPGSSAVSRCGASPGRRCSASSAISRRPPRPSISTTASSATSGTQKSDGWTAMQDGLQPSTACRRFSPCRASQPEPGSRRLQALEGSWKYAQRVCLQQVAADGRGIAQLRRGARQQRFGDGGIGPREVRVVREIGIAHQRADAQARRRPAARCGRDPARRRDVDQAVGPRRARSSSGRAGWCPTRDRPRRAPPTPRRPRRRWRAGHSRSSSCRVPPLALRPASSAPPARPRRSRHRPSSGRDCRSSPRGCARDRRPPGLRSMSPTALMIWPGVQKPHWKPSCAMKAACTGWSSSPRATPSMVVIAAPSRVTASARQELIAPAVDQDGAGAALAAIAALLGAGQVETLAQQVEERDAWIVELDVPLHAIHR